MAKGKSVKEINQSKEQRIMDIVAWRCAYYRANPQRFVSEVLGINLKLFQKIILWAMMHFHYIMYIAARGRFGLLLRKLKSNKVGKIGEGLLS